MKPLVSHVLSKELQLYFERITGIVLSAKTPAERETKLQPALQRYYVSRLTPSVRNSPSIHQLLPYFTQFTFDQVTKVQKNTNAVESP